ncbi:hypothetical protein H4I95_07076 [Botrytis cinerea]
MAPSLRSKILKSLPSRVRKMFTSRAALKNADDKSPVFNPFPFLQLPAELRIQIYEELAPKSESKSRNVLRVTRTHLRKDPERGKYAIERCLTNDASRHYPEILRLNRLIYHEAMPLWYGIDNLQIWIISPVIEFNIKTTLPSNLPYFLRFITSLRIDIFVENDDISSALKSGDHRRLDFGQSLETVWLNMAPSHTFTCASHCEHQYGFHSPPFLHIFSTFFWTPTSNLFEEYQDC